MATDSSKIDFLWKKVMYGVSKTDDGDKKFGSNETIASKTTIFGQDIWAQTTSADIPAVPPGASTGVVKVLTGAARVQATMDGTATANKTWLTNTKDWVPPTFGANYAVAVYIGDPNVGPAARIFPDTTNEDWVFDYNSGVLHFPTNIPGVKGATIGSGNVSVAGNGIYVTGYQYVGGKGLGGAGVNLKVDQFIYVGAPQTSGMYTFANFFSVKPQAGTIDIMFNGVRLFSTHWSVTNQDLVVNLDLIPYDLEDGDVISAQYGFAS